MRSIFPDDYPTSDLGPYFKVSLGEDDIDESHEDDNPPPKGEMMEVEGEEDTLVMDGRAHERNPSPIAARPLQSCTP